MADTAVKPKKRAPRKKKKIESWRNELNQNAMSGSELSMIELEKRLGSEFLEDFQIILSRPRELDPNKIRVLWCHDLPKDPEAVNALSNGGWKQFHKLVFVSHWQQQHFINMFDIPWSHTVVIKNSINEIPVDVAEKFQNTDQLRMIYHTTPHRGLGILVPVFQKLMQDQPDLDIHLDVFSSFELYGWKERDEAFEPLYSQIREHPNMTYHGAQDNDTVREALAKAHIFAYPSIWTETSCIALIEAMSAGCLCIHPNLGALPETSAHWTFQYPFHEDPNRHAAQFYDMLTHGISLIKSDSVGPLTMKLNGQKSFTDVTYPWEVRINEWKGLLDSIRDLPREIPERAEPDQLGAYNYSVDV